MAKTKKTKGFGGSSFKDADNYGPGLPPGFDPNAYIYHESIPSAAQQPYYRGYTQDLYYNGYIYSPDGYNRRCDGYIIDLVDNKGAAWTKLPDCGGSSPRKDMFNFYWSQDFGMWL